MGVIGGGGSWGKGIRGGRFSRPIGRHGSLASSRKAPESPGRVALGIVRGAK